MAKFFYVVLTRAEPGREEELHKWYDAEHLADCVRVPGVIAAKRYQTLYRVGRRSEGSKVIESPYDSVALYEIEADDPLAVAREISARSGTELMSECGAIDPTKTLMMMTEAAGERVANTSGQAD